MWRLIDGLPAFPYFYPTMNRSTLRSFPLTRRSFSLYLRCYPFPLALFAAATLFNWRTAQAQDTIVSHSLYQHIRIADDRQDTTHGATTAAYREYFDALMAGMTDSTAGSRELLLQIRNFHAYGFQEGNGHRGGVWMRMVLYARSDDAPPQYSLLSVLDTAVETTTNIFKKSLHKQAVSITDAILTRFIAANLQRTVVPDAPRYSLAAVHGIENLTKLVLPVYAAASLKDGVYKTYRSFAMQEPDGDMATFRPDSTFAIVQHQQASVFVAAAPFPMVRRDNDFFYVGRIRVYAPTTTEFASISSMVAFVATGGRFAAFWTATQKKDFWMKMDALSGRFAATREVRKEERP